MTTATNNSTNTNMNIKDVLFQKIGMSWYIFSEVKGEVIYSVMPQGMDPRETKLELFHIIEEHMERVASHRFNGPAVSA